MARSSSGRSEHSALHTIVNGLHLWCDMILPPPPPPPLSLPLLPRSHCFSSPPPPLPPPSWLSSLLEPAQRAMSFTGRLRSLAACVSPLPTPPAVLSEISTPWDWRAWEDMLHTHPDREFADIIVNGIREGFRIGFEYRRFGGTLSSDRNMRSALEHPDVVDEYLAEERRRGHVLGPFAQLPACPLIVSRFGVIPKRGRENKWRLIVDLSSPEGCSVNDGIDPQSCSLSYVTVDDIAARIRKLGRCSLIAKCDIKHAYRQVPVHPQDRILLGMRWRNQYYVDTRWRNQYYVDTRLPFGLRSAPLLFSAAAEALEWAVSIDNIFPSLYYLCCEGVRVRSCIPLHR